MKRPNIHRFIEGYGIRCQPIQRAREPRPENVIYGGRVVSRLLRRRGEQHAGFVLSCIQASDPACLYGDVIHAVSQVLRIHRAALGTRHETIEAFSSVDISKLRDRARMLSRNHSDSMTNSTAALAVKIADELLKENYL